MSIFGGSAGEQYLNIVAFYLKRKSPEFADCSFTQFCIYCDAYAKDVPLYERYFIWNYSEKNILPLFRRVREFTGWTDSEVYQRAMAVSNNITANDIAYKQPYQFDKMHVIKLYDMMCTYYTYYAAWSRLVRYNQIAQLEDILADFLGHDDMFCQHLYCGLTMEHDKDISAMYSRIMYNYTYLDTIRDTADELEAELFAAGVDLAKKICHGIVDMHGPTNLTCDKVIAKINCVDGNIVVEFHSLGCTVLLGVTSIVTALPTQQPVRFICTDYAFHMSQSKGSIGDTSYTMYIYTYSQSGDGCPTVEVRMQTDRLMSVEMSAGNHRSRLVDFDSENDYRQEVVFFHNDD